MTVYHGFFIFLSLFERWKVSIHESDEEQKSGGPQIAYAVQQKSEATDKWIRCIQL